MRLLLVLVSIFGVTPAFAQVYCDLWADLAQLGNEPVLYQVKPDAGQVLFQRNGGDGFSCPSDDERCKARAYLIGGDPIVVTSMVEGYACATFTNDGKENISTRGWLPLAMIEPAQLPPAKAADFAGLWRYFDEQTIEINARKDGTLHIVGDATYGANDPNRVASGGVNLGSIAAELKPEGNVVAWTDEDDGSTGRWRPDNEDYLCAVKLWALPPYLVAVDNGMCGGVNVSFTGVYAHAD